MNRLRNVVQTSISRFHTSSIIDDKFTAMKMARNMNKLIKGSNTLKKKWYNPNYEPKAPQPNINSLTNLKGQHSKATLRRVSVLNKLFMRHITDQLSTGDISSKIYGRGIEISKVRVMTDFKLVNIYWLAKGTPEDDATDVILSEIAGILRHQLSQLRLMGEVPKIYFVKDKELSKSMEVEVLLAKADFGEQHQTIDRSYLFKSEFMLNSKLDSEIKEKIKALDNQEEIEETILPTKSEAIFGLDREIIMKRINSSINKSKDAWAGNNTTDTNVVDDINFKHEFLEVDFVDRSDRRNQFQDFLKHRKIAKRKAEKITYGNKSDMGCIDEQEEIDHQYDYDIEEEHRINDCYEIEKP